MLHLSNYKALSRLCFSAAIAASMTVFSAIEASALTARFVSGSSTVVEGFDNLVFNDGTEDITVNVSFVNANVSFDDLYGSEPVPSNPNNFLLLDNTGAFNLADVLIDTINDFGVETLVEGSGDGFAVAGAAEATPTNFLAYTDDPFGDVVDTFAIGRPVILGPTIGNGTPFVTIEAVGDVDPGPGVETVPEPSILFGLIAFGGLCLKRKKQTS